MNNNQNNKQKKRPEKISYFWQTLELSIKAIEDFTKRNEFITKQPEYTENLKRYLTNLANDLKKSRINIDKAIHILINQMKEFEHVSNYLQLSINNYYKWIDKNKAIFDAFNLLWENFQKEYRIRKQEAIRVLKKYKWFITPSITNKFIFEVVRIGRKRGNHRKEMNDLFINYFTSNDYSKLEEIVNNWKKNTIFKPRMKIISDAVTVLKNADRKYNAANLIIPSLIAQIDGIQQDFMKKNGLIPKGRKWKDKKGKEVKKSDFFIKLTKGQDIMEPANDIFLNILFQKAQPGEPLETPFTFNRHKIMHGECTTYGRKDNTIRTFLILDFLATLSRKPNKP